jgi:two-component system, OmpR family, response regulator
VTSRLLIAEDDAQLRDVLVRALRAEGLQARAVGTGRELLEAAAGPEPPDALVVDVGLPDADGRDVCQALRSRGVWTPVLFLTARDALTDRLSGFRAGGDDYVTKPFDLDEVLERLHALLRRGTPGAPGVVRPAAAGQAAGGSEPVLQLDPAELTAALGDGHVALTPTEFRLLAALAAAAGRAVARQALVRGAWPHGAIVHDNTLDVYIARLRRKLRGLPGAPEIVTVHNVGYRLA